MGWEKLSTTGSSTLNLQFPKQHMTTTTQLTGKGPAFLFNPTTLPLRHCASHPFPCRLTVVLFLLSSLLAPAQELSFTTRRQITIPKDATARIGPFHSTITFRQRAGYRYRESVSAAMEEATVLEIIRGEGSDFPVLTKLSCANYMVVNPYMGLNLSFSFNHEYYPLETEESVLQFNPEAEGVVGDISVDLAIGKRLRITVFDYPMYRTDFIDYRGLEDLITGEKYERFENAAGANADWLLARNKNLRLDVTRRDTLPKGDEFRAQTAIEYLGSARVEYLPNRNLLLGPRIGYRDTVYPENETRGKSTITEIGMFVNMDITRTLLGKFDLMQTYDEVVEGDDVTDAGAHDTVAGHVSLEHTISSPLVQLFRFSRDVGTGFGSGNRLTDRYEYQIRWQSKRLTANTGLWWESVQALQGTASDYSTLGTDLNIALPVTRKLNARLCTKLSARENEGDDRVSDSTDWTTTLTAKQKLGRTLQLVFEAEHISRDSAENTLDYQENRLEVYLEFTHTL